MLAGLGVAVRCYGYIKRVSDSASFLLAVTKLNKQLTDSVAQKGDYSPAFPLDTW